MYEIDTLAAYVLAYYNIGEADRKYRILTRDFGVLLVRARSVRSEKSKLKHLLQKFNLVDIDLVSSRAGYQVTGGRLEQALSYDLSFEALAVLDTIGTTIGRLSQGSEHTPAVFEVYQDLTILLYQIETSEQEKSTMYSLLELWATARTLEAFGYFDPAFSTSVPPTLFTSSFQVEDCVILEAHRGVLERYIAQCFGHSML